MMNNQPFTTNELIAQKMFRFSNEIRTRFLIKKAIENKSISKIGQTKMIYYGKALGMECWKRPEDIYGPYTAVPYIPPDLEAEKNEARQKYNIRCILNQRLLGDI